MNTSETSISFNSYRPKLLSRLRAFLFLERDKFSKYLKVLEKMGEDIRDSNSQALLCHQELADSILNEIAVLEKSVRPLWKDYLSHEPELPTELISLKGDIENLRLKSLTFNQENRAAIENSLERLGQLIPRVRFNRNPGLSAGSTPVSRFINISA